MPRRIRTLLAAAAGISALLAAGCTSLPAHSTQDGAMSGMMTGDQQCKMMAQHSGGDGEQTRPMAGKMNGACPMMMQKHEAADAPSAPSLAPPEEHQHTPDTPPAEH